MASNASILSTASPQPAIALHKMVPVRALAIILTAMATASYRLPSALEYSELTAAQTLPVALATRITGTSVDYKERLRERIRSIMIEAENVGDGVPPSPDAINDALRFVDLLPADSQVPHVSVADDGEINFFRRGDGIFVDIGFFGDRRIHYYACVERLGIDLDGSQPFSGCSLPRDLVVPITTG